MEGLEAPRSEAPDFEVEGRAYYVLFLLVLVGACNLVDRQILTILLQPIKQELGASDTAMGFLTGFGFAAFFVVAGFPLARWADRGSRRSIIALCVRFWSLMTMASGFATSFLQLALARVGTAVGEAGSAPAIASLVADHFPRQGRGRAMAVVFIGPAIGVFVGLMLGGWINQAFGWRVAFVAVGAPGLLLALVMRFSIAEPGRGRDAPSAKVAPR
jgi:predicted MFS family arabinose efflux permease